MRTYYTTEDVLRWEQAALNGIPLQLDKLREAASPDHRWQRYGHLSGHYHTLAMIAVSRKQFAEALGFMRKSLEADFEQHEIRRAQGQSTSAGDFQFVLVAYVTADPELIAKMVEYYQWQDGVAESVYLGKIIKWLSLGDIPTALTVLAQKRPRIEKMFEAYPDCLLAMAHKDQAAFQDAISAGSKNWARRAARFEKGLPDSVCFLQGAGLIRLAEQVIGAKLSIADENIPAGLLA